MAESPGIYQTPDQVPDEGGLVPNDSIGGTTVPDFVIGPGFKAEIDKRGWHPASDEDYFSQSANAKVSVAVCEEGILWYSSASNKVGATPFA